MFNETRLLDCVAYGSSFGHEFSTLIKSIQNGYERRKGLWNAPLGRYEIRYQALEPEDSQLVLNAHYASMGSLIPFRFKDWKDYIADNERLGEAVDGEQTMQLVKRYQFGPVPFVRRIHKPVWNTITVYADDEEIPATIDYIDGTATFMAEEGQVITWSGEFDVPVRFESDRLDFTPDVKIEGGFAMSADVALVEVRL